MCVRSHGSWDERIEADESNRASGKQNKQSQTNILIELSLPLAVVCTSAKLSLINMTGNGCLKDKYLQLYNDFRLLSLTFGSFESSVLKQRVPY